MPVSTEQRIWKVTFRNVNTQEVDIVYPTAISRRDAVDLASESTKLDPAACIVTATTVFDHAEMEAKKEEEFNVMVDALPQYAKDDLVEQNIPVGAYDRDKLPCSEEEYKEELIDAMKKTNYGKSLPEDEELEIINEDTPEEEEETYFRQEADKMLKIMHEVDIENKIENAIIDFFLRHFLPNMSIVQVLEMFQNTTISFGQLKEFLEKRMKEDHVEITF